MVGLQATVFSNLIKWTVSALIPPPKRNKKRKDLTNWSVSEFRFREGVMDPIKFFSLFFLFFSCHPQTHFSPSLSLSHKRFSPHITSFMDGTSYDDSMSKSLVCAYVQKLIKMQPTLLFYYFKSLADFSIPSLSYLDFVD